MERLVFNQQWLALVKAFLYAEKKVDLETQDVYWEMLKGIPEDKFVAGVKKCLAEGKFFPTIHELGEASLPPRQKTFKTTGRFVTYEQHWSEQVNNKDREVIPDNVRKLITEL